jgi:hypothetical protein
VSGLARRSRIGWRERNTIIHGLAEDGRILTQSMCAATERMAFLGRSYRRQFYLAL